MSTFNYIMLAALPFFIYFSAASRNILHPVMISMFAGLFPFLLGIQLSIADNPDLTAIYSPLLLMVFAGCFLGKKKGFNTPSFEIDMKLRNAKAHKGVFYIAVLLAAAALGFMFMKKGIPILSAEPNIAKVTFSQDGGWMATRLVRYFLLTLFYASVIYCFHSARMKIKAVRKRPFETGLGEMVRFSGKGWLLLGAAILVLFTTLGYKANVLAFFLWSACFIGLVTRVRLSTLAPFLAAGAVFSLAALYMIQKTEGLGDLMVFLYMRSTTSAAEGLIYVLSNYGATEPFLYGEGFWFDLSNIFLKLGLSPVLPFQLHELNFDAVIFEKILGHNEYRMQATTSLFGQIYVNFGLPATMAGTFIFFFYFVRFGDFLVRGRKTAIGTPVYFLLFQQYQTFIAGGPILITVFDTAFSIAAFFGAYAAVYFFMRMPTGSLSFKIP